jgi:hypothetical protein
MKKIACLALLLVGLSSTACGPDAVDNGLFGPNPNGYGWPSASAPADGGSVDEASVAPGTDAAAPLPGQDAASPPPNPGDAGTVHHHDGSVPPTNDAGAPPPSDAGVPPAQDAGSPPPPSDAGAQAPTWTQIYDTYFATGTVGVCGSCHSNATSPSATYTWLKGQGYINGAQTSLSFLTWSGGNMPPSGPASLPQATADVNAWIAAGALDN